jgi:hypothetical protein
LPTFGLPTMATSGVSLSCSFVRSVSEVIADDIT